MALPASQYSVLDAQKIERLDDSTFQCHVGRVGFLGWGVEPVLTVSVIVEPEGPTVKLLDTKVCLDLMKVFIEIQWFADQIVSFP